MQLHTREHVEVVEGAGGPKAVVKGRRIQVIDIADRMYRDGMSAQQIVDEFETITLADVFAALAYYWDNREALEAKRNADDAFEAWHRANRAAGGGGGTGASPNTRP
jgi:uncharacterized protein (DUF433 family)